MAPLYAVPEAAAALDVAAAFALSWAPHPGLKLLLLALIRPPSYLPLAAACLLTGAWMVNVSGVYPIFEHSDLSDVLFYASWAGFFWLFKQWRHATAALVVIAFLLAVALFAALWRVDVYSAIGNPYRWSTSICVVWACLFTVARLGLPRLMRRRSA